MIPTHRAAHAALDRLRSEGLQIYRPWEISIDAFIEWSDQLPSEKGYKKGYVLALRRTESIVAGPRECIWLPKGAYMHNRSKRGSLGFFGVQKRIGRKSYRNMIQHVQKGRKRIYDPLTYKTPEEAAKAYDMYAIRFYGPYHCNLNYPVKGFGVKYI